MNLGIKTKSSENPFYGMKNTLQLYQHLGNGTAPLSMLNAAHKECTTKEKLALLFVMLFSAGDITNRQHNLFNFKASQGGDAHRELFRDSLIPFMVSILPKEKMQEFIHLIVQYSVLDNILALRVQTKKNTNRIISIYNCVDVFGEEEVLKYLVRLYNGNAFEKYILAKFFTNPKSRKRMQKETKQIHLKKQSLLRRFCDMVSLPYAVYENNIKFVGWKNWKSQFNNKLESYMFSSKAILDLDELQFINFIQQLPSDARFRVKKKLLANPEKYKNQVKWFNNFQQFKENAQQEQRILEQKIEEGTATLQDKIKLKQVKKNARVNFGAFNFINEFDNVMTGNVDWIKFQPFLDTINLNYKYFVIVDDSGSMSMRYGKKYSPRDFSAFIMSFFLYKSKEASNIVGLFSRDFRVFNHINGTSNKDQYSYGSTKSINKPLIDKTKSFKENYTQIKGFLNFNSTGNGTNVASIADYMIKWIERDNTAIDQLSKLPIWVIISDGNFNNKSNVTASLLELFDLMKKKVGFVPLILLIDVAYGVTKIDNFQGMENMVMLPPNPNNILELISGMTTFELPDIYQPLMSKYKNNRYDPVKRMILG